MEIEIDDKIINEHKSVKYLRILIDCHWKEHIQQLSKKISRGIGILCKISILCCCIKSGVTPMIIKPLLRMQKKVIRLITKL